MADLKLFHEEIMQEEGVKMSELPVELQKKIKGFNLMRKRLEKNPEDEMLFIQLQKKAVKLGDEVQNFIENDYDEEDEEEDDDSKKEGSKKPAEKDDSSEKSKSKSKSKEEDEEEDDEEDDKKNKSSKKEGGQVDKQPRKPSGKFGNLMMEKKILSIMEARGEKRIKISDLESIIGCEPDYPEQEVNNIKLRKVFLSNDYRLV